MYKNTYLLKHKSILIIFLAMFFTSCGPELNEIEIPPIENYKAGIPLFDGGVGFQDLLSEDDLEMLQTDPNTGGLFFSIQDSIDIASTEEIVKAFGSTSEEDFFSLQFPNPLEGGSIPGSANTTVAFTIDEMGACSQADFCISLANDIEDAVAISYLKFKRGGLQVDYTAQRGDVITLTMDNVEASDGATSISISETASFDGTQPPVTLDLTSVILDLNNTPILTLSLTDAQGTPSGTISRIQLTPTNSAEHLKMIFLSGRDAIIDVPTDQINTDYLSDIFPEDAEVVFSSPTISFNFVNPIGANVNVDLGPNSSTNPPKNGINAVNNDGLTLPITFSSDSLNSLSGTNCSQVINVMGTVDFNTVTETKVYVCETDDLLNTRPTQIVYDGVASYGITANQEVLFSAGAEVKAYFDVKIPLHIGFSNLSYSSGSELDLNFTSELEKISKAIIRSEITNTLPMGGSLKLTVKESENGATTAEIYLNGNQDGQDLIKAATTDPDGTNAKEVVNYLETSLTEGEIRAVLNAGYLDMSFILKADADPNTTTPEPVVITMDQSMYFKMGIFLESTIKLDLE